MDSRYIYKSNKYRTEIDGIRALAVIAVIINHFNKDILPYGYLGVDIFFVLSGYVITSSLRSRKSNNLQEFISGFYARRIKRIIPALIFFVLISILLTCFFQPIPRVSLNTGFSSLFGLSNIYLAKIGTDYFAQSTELNPFTHTWSLGVEEQFYLIYPLLTWSSGFNKNKNYKNLLFLILIFSILSFISFFHFYSPYQASSIFNKAYFLMPFRFWQISLGCIAFLIIDNNLKIKEFIKKIPSLIPTLLIITIMFIPFDIARSSTIYVSLSTAALLVCIKKKDKVYKLFNNQKIRYIGLISYSLYLWHWGILAFSRMTIGIHWWTVPFQLILIFLFAYISYNFIEKPFRNEKNNLSNIKTIFRGFIVLISSGSLIFGSRLINDKLFIGNKNRNFFEIYSERNLWEYDLCKYDDKKRKSIYYQKYDHCWVDSNNKLSKPSTRKIRKIFAFGNSYNSQLVPSFVQIINEGEHKINAIYTEKCEVIEMFNKNLKRGQCNTNFYNYFNWVKKNSQKGDILFISNSVNDFYSDGFRRSEKESLISLEKYIKNLKKIQQELGFLGVNLIVNTGIPLLKQDPDTCSQWFASLNNKCKIKKILNQDQNKMIKLVNKSILEKSDKNFLVISFYDDLEKEIKNTSEPWDLYYNPNHLSRKGALLLTDKLKKNFKGQ